MAISFKSVGKTKEQQTSNTISSTPIPVGIKTPITFDSNGLYTFSMHSSLEDQLHDNLRNLILTNHGEHLGIYDLGANLRPLTTEFTAQEKFDSAAIERINTAVTKWMPFIALEDYLSEISSTKNLTLIKLTITYTIPALQTAKKALQITLYAI